jgi:hypothetical protein
MTSYNIPATFQGVIGADGVPILLDSVGTERLDWESRFQIFNL